MMGGIFICVYNIAKFLQLLMKYAEKITLCNLFDINQ